MQAFYLKNKGIGPFSVNHAKVVGILLKRWAEDRIPEYGYGVDSDLDQVVFNGKLHHIDRCFQVDLPHDVVFVRFNGPDAYKQFVGNFAVCVAFGKESKYFHFAFAERSGRLVF